MTRCESYPLCSGTIYFPTAPSFSLNKLSEYINIGRDCIEKTEQSKKIIIFTESGTLCIRNAIYYYICCILRILHREYGDYEFSESSWSKYHIRWTGKL